MEISLEMTAVFNHLDSIATRISNRDRFDRRKWYFGHCDCIAYRFNYAVYDRHVLILFDSDCFEEFSHFAGS